MRSIFICYASEDKPAAERIQIALASAGYKVFFDEQSLPPGGDYHARIQEAIRRCNLFIFLASSHSIAPSKFTLTELKFVRSRWPSPVGHVLTVNLQDLKTSDLPAYLAGATILVAAGSLPSEVRAAAEEMLARGRVAKAIWVIAGVGALVTALGVALFTMRPRAAGAPMGPLETGWNYDKEDLDPAGWRLVHSPEECSDLCYQREACRAMTYVISNNTCWLKSAVPPRAPNSDMISAVKQQPSR